jgi:alkylation response protein AidB-like acyl-CoA dehydrogenase
VRFALSDEQADLAATVRSLLAKRADSAATRAAISSDAGYDTALWETLCTQVGVAALAIPEDDGGVGASLFETMVVIEEIGRALTPSPLLATVVAAEGIAAGSTPDVRAELLPRIAAGETATLAAPGQPSLFAAEASIVVVTDGDVLRLASPSAVVPAPSLDPLVRLGCVADVTDAAAIGDGAAARGRAELVGAVGVSAMAAGLAARALDMTVAYTKERVQFGRPIGSFQALKHRMADLLVLVEMARSASWAASYALATDASDAAHLAHAAKSYCCEAASAVAAETVQLHGGIAITWEHDAQLVFKHAQALRELFGAPRTHRAAITL